MSFDKSATQFVDTFRSDWNVAALSDLLTLETDYASIQREEAGLPALSLAQEAELMSKVLAQRFLTTYSRDEVRSAFTLNIQNVVTQQPDVLQPSHATLSALLSMPEVLSLPATPTPMTPPPLKPSLSTSICSSSVDECSDDELQHLLQPLFVDQSIVVATPKPKPERCDSGFQDMEDLLLAAILSVKSKPASEATPRSLDSWV
jgi:hypothetical protein